MEVDTSTSKAANDPSQYQKHQNTKYKIQNTKSQNPLRGGGALATEKSGRMREALRDGPVPLSRNTTTKDMDQGALRDGSAPLSRNTTTKDMGQGIPREDSTPATGHTGDVPTPQVLPQGRTRKRMRVPTRGADVSRPSTQGLTHHHPHSDPLCIPKDSKKLKLDLPGASSTHPHPRTGHSTPLDSPANPQSIPHQVITSPTLLATQGRADRAAGADRANRADRAKPTGSAVSGGRKLVQSTISWLPLRPGGWSNKRDGK